MQLWKVICVAVLMMQANTVFAQSPQYAYRISFSDKQGAPPLTDPLVFLSQRALDRRTAQGIAIDGSDQPVSPVYINDVLTLTGGKMHLTSRWLNYCVILVNDQADIQALQGKPYITGIKYIAYYQNGLHKMVKDRDESRATHAPKSAKKTTDASYYGGAFPQTDIVNGQYLHNRGYKGQGKLIAVFDAGFTYTNTNPAFDSLIQSGRLIDKYNFNLANDNVFSFDSHGTCALSTMAANIPGTYVGTAPAAEYAIYVTEASGEREIELDNMVAATERSDSLGADVISVSLGYNTFDAPFNQNSFVYADLDGKSTIVAKAANIATSKGILFAVSAGNEGAGGWKYVLTPADADSALTVGSVDLNRNIAGNSGYGPNASGKRKPDVCAVGQPAMVLASGPNPIGIAGTSFAIPQIAGWAACLMQSISNPTPYRIRQAIIESAHAFTYPDNHLGYGVPNFYVASELLNVKDAPSIPDEDEWVKVMPNPFNNSFSINIYQTAKATVSISVTDATGKLVHKSQQEVSKGIYNIPVDINEVPAGVYFVNVISGDRSGNAKIVKQ